MITEIALSTYYVYIFGSTNFENNPMGDVVCYVATPSKCYYTKLHLLVKFNIRVQIRTLFRTFIEISLFICFTVIYLSDFVIAFSGFDSVWLSLRRQLVKTGPADATATPSSLASLKSRLV